ncbi:MAG TPA: hypothetical protein VEJ36_04365 [Nitrososphaerales archaeon]|nr:hypothetical protein [Nitrososphaerales archaeon]
MNRQVSYGSILLTAILLYLIGVWFHVPYGGGHVYSDIVTVFQVDLCPNTPCTVPIPYLQAFVEYPIGTAFFMYAMGALGAITPGQLLTNYYVYSCIFLLIPTLLLMREMRKIAMMRGLPNTKLLWFFIITPTFVFMLLVNWYVIGTYFTFAGIRYYLEGRKRVSAAFLAFSALANLVTAAAALGLIFAEPKVRDALEFGAVGGLVYAIPNLLVYLANPTNWLHFWSYQYHWYIEDSWMEAVMTGTSPLRHVVPDIVFAALAVGMLGVRLKLKDSDPLFLAFLATFSFVFSTYVYTPQMNVLLLPFFVLLPVSSHYLEFLTFDVLNSLILVWGFSQVLLPIGITYSVQQFGVTSPIQIIAMVRSLWVGKFVVYNGFYRHGWKERKTIGTVAFSNSDRIPAAEGL